MIWRLLDARRHYPVPTAILAGLLGLAAIDVHVIDAQARGYGYTFAMLARVERLLLVAAGVLFFGGLLWWLIVWLVIPTTTGTRIDRRDEEDDHARGVATRIDIAQHASAAAMRRKATLLRPSLARLTWWRRRRTPVTDYAVKLVTAGAVSKTSDVWSSCEDVAMRIGGPRNGKSGSMVPHIRSAPGPIVVTSTRADLLEHTERARARKGRVLVFNPTGIGDLPSTVRWSPLIGCTDFATAQRRADDLIPPSTGEAERWDTQARGLLAILLHAAALLGPTHGSNGTVRQIGQWLSHPDKTTETEICAALKASPEAQALQSDIHAALTTNSRTLTSITATLRPAIRWASESTAAAVGDASLSDTDLLDIAGFVTGHALAPDRLAAELDRLDLADPFRTDTTPVQGRMSDRVAEPSVGETDPRRFDSLYLVGREGSCRPLLGALTAEIAHQARMAAARQVSGRLDPPLALFLDEAPLTCGPIPLHDWTADMGGRGVWIHLTAQSLAQLRDCWGADRAAAIQGNVSALMIFGGIKNKEDLETLSALAGTRMRRLDEDDIRPVPVMSPAQITRMRKGEVLLIINGLRPVIGRARMGWHSKPVIYLLRGAKKARTVLQPVAEAAWQMTRRGATRAATTVQVPFRAVAERARQRRADRDRLARALAEARLRDRAVSPIPPGAEGPAKEDGL
jgi:type IV secretion system protein VirD4